MQLYEHDSFSSQLALLCTLAGESAPVASRAPQVFPRHFVTLWSHTWLTYIALVMKKCPDSFAASEILMEH